MVESVVTGRWDNPRPETPADQVTDYLRRVQEIEARRNMTDATHEPTGESQ